MPVFVFFTNLAGFGLALLLVPAASPATLWGVWAAIRLKRDTQGRGSPGET
jgi:hypothetical protein